MDQPFLDSEFNRLIGSQAGPCSSIYMPIHRSSGDATQDEIRLKNLLHQTTQDFDSIGLSKPQITDILEPAWKLQKDRHFWIYNSNDGLAIFMAPEVFKFFRIPVIFNELLIVSTGRFHIKPLYSALAQDGRYFLVAISKNAIRIFAAARAAIIPIPLPNHMPKRMTDVTGMIELERSIQQHTVHEGGGAKVGIIHGQGTPKDFELDLLFEYFRRIAPELERILNRPHIPVILASVDRYRSIFRETARIPNLLDDVINGSPDELTSHELHTRSWAIYESWRQKQYGNMRELYQNLLSSGRSSQELTTVVRSAFDGQVDTLFALGDKQIWGTYIIDKRVVEIAEKRRPEDDDLVDLCVQESLSHQGRVYLRSAEELPRIGHEAKPPDVSAIFRW